MTTKWINVISDLPEQDGRYAVAHWIGVDGWDIQFCHFLNGRFPRSVKYWMPVTPPLQPWNEEYDALPS